jgi:5-methylcytosine-specific restriction enzyme subunit McrC
MIPVQNLYYLLLYAWDVMTPSRLAEVDGLPRTSVLDLLASLLQQGVDRLLRRGIDRGYLPQVATIPGIRGKLDVSGTVKNNLRPLGRALCEFDELSQDVPHNRILKATIRVLLRTPDLDPKIQAGLRRSFDRLSEVRDVNLTDALFRSVQVHRGISSYRLLLDVSRLVHDCLVPERSGRRLRFREFERDEKRMRIVFERFVRNFYRHEQTSWRVRREIIRWEATTGLPDAMEVLPRMETDVSLTRPGRRLVIDTKYYPEPLVTRYDRRKIRSPHLYQLSAYLMNLRARADAEPSIEGMLLYPAASETLDYRFRMHGSKVRVRTVDLNQHWTEIRKELIAISESA